MSDFKQKVLDIVEPNVSPVNFFVSENMRDIRSDILQMGIFELQKPHIPSPGGSVDHETPILLQFFKERNKTLFALQLDKRTKLL
jgi:hypothetical protein